MHTTQLTDLAKLLRHHILQSSTTAGSGHPSSSLSAVELMGTLFFGGTFHYDFDNPSYIFNDRLIFSKGHASPLFYSLYTVAGKLSYDELLTFRKIDSNLEGHPTPRFKYTEASTGSLGQGLSIGVGMALGIRLHEKQLSKKLSRKPRVFVLIGDSEIAEGQVWEGLEIASQYKLGHLIGILDVNRLGQRGETMLGWDLDTYKQRIESFGWNTVIVDGHNLTEVQQAYSQALKNIDTEKPTMIIAKTIKGKGVSSIENKDGWHGKTLTSDMLSTALNELGPIDITVQGSVTAPERIDANVTSTAGSEKYVLYDKAVATREAYGDALVAMGASDTSIVVLDAEVSNSTYAETFKKAYPDRFFEMYIAEQNMVSVGVGLSKIGFKPFISSFAAFLTRAFDQIRMAQYSEARLHIAGSHAGVSIGQDGSSQMGLEDIAMMRSLLQSVVLYPSDGPSTVALSKLMQSCQYVSYLRLTREKTQSLYTSEDTFVIGGSKVLKQSMGDKVTLIAAGITLHESLKAYEELQKTGIPATVIDAYSIKPIDKDTIVKHAEKTGHIIVVEDHYPYGGLGSAVMEALAGTSVSITHLCVKSIPHSGTPEELLEKEQINSATIVKTVRQLLRRKK